MKTIKRILPVFFILLASFASRADILFEDATNYPYANGLIETQGQWYAYSPSTPHGDAYVTNNVLILNSTNVDSVAAPTNGWTPGEFNFASFRINVYQLPSSTNGGYFCQLQNQNDTDDVSHVFIDTRETSVPGTYRLAIGNYTTSFGAQAGPPHNYPMDMATGVWYNVVFLFDNNNSAPFPGGTLWVNPTWDDYSNAVSGVNDLGDGLGVNYSYATDKTTSTGLLNIAISQIGFSPYANAGISNVIAATTFDEVNSTNLPVFGIDPQSATNYSGNPTTFYAVASGVDVTYQWYSTTFGALSDSGGQYTGSASDTLTVNDQTSSDTYYCVVTDAYGNTLASSNAVDTVITSPTAVFFPASELPVTNTANLFTTTGFTNTALGTGPISYQWYLAPTNTPTKFSPLSGQTSPSLNLSLADYTYQGNYFLLASNSVAGGSLAYGPTNTVIVIAPLVATMLQLHALLPSEVATIKAGNVNPIYVNTNNVTVSGYVSQFEGYGTSYSEFFIQDASGYGIEVYLPGFGNMQTPPVGTYLTISAPLEIYNGELELAVGSPSAMTPGYGNSPIEPRLENAIFADLATNAFGTNGLALQCSLVTFTNCYLYGNKTGGALGITGNQHDGINGKFENNYYTSIYFTAGGPYNAAIGHTNVMSLFQPTYDYSSNSVVVESSPFDNQFIPTNCVQLTGIYVPFSGSGELQPSRLADYATNTVAPFTVAISETGKIPTVTWSAQPGSTYSANSSTNNVLGPWAQAAYGLGYYPTNGTFTDTNVTHAKFYYITSP